MARPYLIKLVRDKMGDLLGENGRLVFKPVPKRQAAKLRRKKLIEEAIEFAMDPSASEAADVYQALTDCIRDLPDVSFHDVLELSLQKNAERGGFSGDMGMYCYTTSDGTHDSPDQMITGEDIVVEPPGAVVTKRPLSSPMIRQQTAKEGR